MKNNLILLTVFVLALLISFSVKGQSVENYNLHELLKENRFNVHNRKLSPLTDGKKQGVSLSKNQKDGIAWLKDIQFTNGTIEVDIRGEDLMGRSFVGIAFHGVNDSTYDAIYFRPFNFQSTDPVRRSHAVQYISHPLYTWKKLRDEYPGKYENAISPTVQPDDWFHVRIDVKDNTIKVYVNDAKSPTLEVAKINKRNNGSVGLWVGNGSGGDFANLILSEDK